MAKDKSLKKPKSSIEKFKTDQAHGASLSLLEELFNDFHRNRHQVYVMNFVRGIMFGLGSVLGGTIVIALIVWLLSLFSDTWLGPVINEIVDAVDQSKT